MANDKIIQLNQTAERIVQVLDNVDVAMSVKNAEGNITGREGKYWITGQDEDGKDIILTQKLSDDQEYKDLQNEIEAAQTDVSNMQDSVGANTEDLKTLDERVKLLEANMDMIASKITITRITPATVSTLYSKPDKIEYSVTSEDSSGAQTGALTVTWRRGGVNGVLLKTESVQQGDNSFDLTGYLNEGENTITATFLDSYGTSRSMNWQVNAVNIVIESEFDDTITYDGAATISYVAKGSVEKTVHFELDGEEVYSVVIGATNNNTQSYNIPHKEHGTYSLTIYMTATIGTTSVTSNKLYFDIMFVDAGRTETLIRWPYDTTIALEQYQPVTFEYSVYTPNQTTSDIQLLEDGLVVSSRTVESTEQEWTYRPQQYGSKELTIQCVKDGEVVASKTKTITINKFPYDITPVTGNLELDFNPTGRTNDDVNYQSFEYTGTSGITTTMSVNEGFDWNNGGWQTDENGNTYFCIKAGDRMTLSYPLFKDGKDAKGYGKNIKMTYKATNCRDFKAPVMSCNEERGITHTKTIDTVVTAIVDEEEVITKTSETIYYVNFVNPEDENDILPNDTVLGVTTTTETAEDGTVTEITTTITSESSYVGLDVQAQDATLYCQTGKIEAVYCEDKLMELEFNIESQGNLKNTMTAYTNADPIKIELYDAGTASFTHTVAQPIVFGSDKCDVHLYRFKAYSTMLSDNDIMSNYIADALNATEMVERFKRNDILNNQTGALDYEKLSRLYPDLRIILITCPRFTNDKDDKVEGCTVQQIMGNQDPKHNWTASNVRIKGQGTSSNEYGTSARNIDLKFNKYTVTVQEEQEDGTTQDVEREVAFAFSDGTYDTEYAMTDQSIPVNYINVKVNVASSENANNSRLAQRFHQYNPYKRPARVEDPRVRDTMEFHPCVIFIKELGYRYDEEGNKVTELPQEFPASETEFSFYACGDFGNSKKNHEALGMDEDNLSECIVEISNNTHPVCRFQRPEGWSDILPVGFDTTTNQLTDYADFWDGDAIEFRYPEDLYAAAINKKNEWKQDEIEDARARLAVLQPAVQRLWRWVESTDTTKATNIEFETPITLASVEYTADTEEYRKAKFINEYQNYFQQDSLLFHYLFTDRYLMIDNRAKNVFIHTEDGLIWDFCFDYDNDTSLGCDNRGDLKFDYFYEDIDRIGGETVYNAQDSVLWINVRNLLWDDLKVVYDNTKDCWSADSLIQMFKDYQSYKPERLEMIDMRRKYIRPYKEGHYRTNLKEGKVVSQGQYLPMLNGKKELQRERYEKYRSIYTDSKYQSTAIKDNLITWRAGSPDYANPNAENHITVTWGEYYEITPYCDMYLYLDLDETLTTPVRAKAGQPEKIYKPDSMDSLGGDKNTRLYGASMISSVGDLAPFFIRQPDFAKAIRLSELKIGDSSADYRANSEFNTLTLGSNVMLEKLDLHGCQNLKIGLDLSGCVGLKELYTERSGITGVTFADGGLIEIAKLNAIGALKAHNLKNLQTFTLANYLQLTSINVENVPQLSSKSFIEQCKNATTLRLIGINWDLTLSTDATFLDKFLDNEKYSGLDVNGITTDYPVFSGTAEFFVIKESQLNKYREIWPTLDIRYDEANLIPQFLVTWKNTDGTILYEEYVDRNVATADPVERGLISVPTRDPDAEYEYIWNEEIRWTPADGGSELGNPVFSERTFVASYIAIPRTYTVTWTSRQQSYTQTVQYGESANVDLSAFNLEPYKDTTTSRYYVFDGWDASTGYVTEDLTVNAIWESAFMPAIGADTSEFNAAELYAIKYENAWSDYFEIGDRVQFKMGSIPTYKNMKQYNLITEPTYFNGSTCIEAKDENNEVIKLLAEDRNWTMLLEFEGTSTGALVSCFNETQGNGLFAGLYSNTQAVCWGSYTNSVKISNERERFVIQHKKGETSLDVVYAHPSGGIRTSIQSLSKGGTLQTTQAPLVFGATKSPTGAVANYGIGWIYNCILWDGLLGKTDSLALTKWTGETISFDVVDRGHYQAGQTDADVTNIDLMASGALHFVSPFSNQGTETNWMSTKLAEFLNVHFYEAIPSKYRNLMAFPRVRYSNSSDSTSRIANFWVWLPAAVEVGLSVGSAIGHEGSKFAGISRTWLSRRWRGAWPAEYTDTIPSNTIYSTEKPVGEYENGMVWAQCSSSSYYNPKETSVYLYDNGDWRLHQWNNVRWGDIILRTASTSYNYILYFQHYPDNFANFSQGGLLVPCISM